MATDLTPEQISAFMAEMGRKGGRARAARMSQDDRSNASRLAAQHPRPSRRKATEQPVANEG